MSSSDPQALQRRLEAHLQRELRDGTQFFKSRHLADDLDVSAKRVGVAMGTLRRNSESLDITDWGGTSNGSTWYVKPRGDLLGAVNRPPAELVMSNAGQHELPRVCVAD